MALDGSVLANDYDPAGSALEVVPVTNGNTTAGGNYSIDAAGIITYTPPGSSYAGADGFTYQMHKSPTGSNVSAAVTINVGIVQRGVFAKMVQRNLQPDPYRAEIWIDFFSDASGTVLLNTTGLGFGNQL